MKFAKNVQLLSKTRNPNNRLSFPPLPSQCWLNGTFCPQICRDWREDKIFGAKPQKFGADGAFLENFEQIFEKLWLRNAIKAIFIAFYITFFENLPKISKTVPSASISGPSGPGTPNGGSRVACPPGAKTRDCEGLRRNPNIVSGIAKGRIFRFRNRNDFQSWQYFFLIFVGIAIRFLFLLIKYWMISCFEALWKYACFINVNLFCKLLYEICQKCTTFVENSQSQ